MKLSASEGRTCGGVLLTAAEGISYLGVYGIVAWSLYTKVSTGSGLPAGPSGLLGAVEGFSYLTVLACKYPFTKAEYASLNLQQLQAALFVLLWITRMLQGRALLVGHTRATSVLDTI